MLKLLTCLILNFSGYEQTYAELDTSVKNTISHRCFRFYSLAFICVNVYLFFTTLHLLQHIKNAQFSNKKNEVLKHFTS